MVSEIRLDDAEIEAHLFAGTLNLENSNRMTGKKILSLNFIFSYQLFF